jgi:hypothetical protein
MTIRMMMLIIVIIYSTIMLYEFSHFGRNAVEVFVLLGF